MDPTDLSHLEPSAQILITEHQRLAELYLHNSEMGEKRTSLYISVASLGAAGLIGLAQFMGADQLFWPANALLLGMLALGLLTFQRLLERRVRAVENLRALNRIHRYFVDNDPALAPYFYWPPCDDVPGFSGQGGVFAGLRDVIAFINSLFGGILLGEIVSALWPQLQNLVPIGLGAAAMVGLWTLHQVREKQVLQNASRLADRRDVHFPLAAFKEET